MDTIANFLTIIRNGYLAKRDTVEAKHTRLSEDIAAILQKEGYIVSFEINGDSPRKTISLTLRYLDKNLPAITSIKRVSKGSVRVYSKHNQIPTALSGAGTTIVSTSQGLMTGKSAKEKHLGGEVICQIW